MSQDNQTPPDDREPIEPPIDDFDMAAPLEPPTPPNFPPAYEDEAEPRPRSSIPMNRPGYHIRGGMGYAFGLDKAVIGRMDEHGHFVDFTELPTNPPIKTEPVKLTIDGESIDIDSINDFTHVATITGHSSTRLTEFLGVDPPGARLMYRAGDKVRTRRPLPFGVPVGTFGIIRQLEHPESVGSQKGRPYLVMLDMTPYNIRYPDELRALYETTRAPGDPDMPEYMTSVAVNARALDLELIEKGENWRDDYKHPYHYDELLEAQLNMTDEEFIAEVKNVIDGLLKPRQMQAEALEDEAGDGTDYVTGEDLSNDLKNC